MFGGSTTCAQGGIGWLQDLWLWTGITWHPLVLDCQSQRCPSQREGASLASDPFGHIVLFGGWGPVGSSFVYHNDTWIFDGRAWQQLTSDGATGSPPAREYAGFALLGGENVLVGGDGPAGVIGDEWEWVGSTWRNGAFTSSSIFRRTDAALVPDLFSSASAIGYGGQIDFSNSVNSFRIDTYSAQYSCIGGACRVAPVELGLFGPYVSQFGFAPYPPGSSFILFGGRDFVNPGLAGTWRFVPGSGWFGVQLAPGLAPLARRQTAMAYDALSGNIVMFGGCHPDTRFQQGCATLADTWTWGKQVACVPLPDSTISVGSTVQCFFKLGTGATFDGWTADGFAVPHPNDTTATFHTENPGPATITANWTDAEGSHTSNFDYSIAVP
jgi:uncharacterized repeat protein (TIGR02543 family)